MNSKHFARSKCYYCEKSTQWKLGATIAVNGAIQVYWVCQVCDKRAQIPARNIPHKTLENKGIEIKSIEVVNDYRGFFTCARCGSKTAEYHHWAPRHLFDDPESWPGDYLCIRCHNEWHSTVTPNMGTRSKDYGEGKNYKQQNNAKQESSQSIMRHQ